MKRGTPDHPKTADLMRRLKVSRPLAVGLLEMLWHFTAEYAKRGDVGRYTDEQIAQALEWEGNAAALVAALADSGWLDPNRRCRFLVHDWFDHADDAVHKSLARSHQRFASGQIPKLTRLSGLEKNEIAEWFRAHSGRTSGAPPWPGPLPEPEPEPGPGPGPQGELGEASAPEASDPEIPQENPPTAPPPRSHPNGRGPVTDETVLAIERLAADLNQRIPSISQEQWIARASRMEADARRGARLFRTPREPGVSEAWAGVTLKKLSELLEGARRPPPL